MTSSSCRSTSWPFLALLLAVSLLRGRPMIPGRPTSSCLTLGAVEDGGDDDGGGG